MAEEPKKVPDFVTVVLVFFVVVTCAGLVFFVEVACAVLVFFVVVTCAVLAFFVVVACAIDSPAGIIETATPIPQTAAVLKNLLLAIHALL